MTRAIIRKQNPIQSKLIEIGRCYKGSPMGTSNKGAYKGGDDYASLYFRFEPADRFKFEPASNSQYENLHQELKANWDELMAAGSIKIRFPYSSVADNFVYTNRVTKKIGSTTKTFRECDGLTCTKWVESKPHPSKPGQTIPVFKRGEKPCSATEGKSCPEGCEAKGMLKFMVPDLYAGGIILFPLGSPVDIGAIAGYLEPWQNLDLTAVPFSLFRMETNVDYEDKGEIKSKKNWGLHLEIDPGIRQLMLQGAERRLRAELQGFTTQVQVLPGQREQLALAPTEEKPLRFLKDSDDGFQFAQQVQQAIRDRDLDLLNAAVENARELVLGELYRKESMHWIDSELSRGMDAIGMVATSTPKAKPQKLNDLAGKTHAEVLLEKFESSVKDAKTVEQLQALQKWIRLPKQWAIANTIPDIESKVMALTGDRILELGTGKVSPPDLDEEEEGEAIEVEAAIDEYPEFETEEVEQ